MGSALLSVLVIAGAIFIAIYQFRTKQKYNISSKRDKITTELHSMNTSGGDLQLENNMAYISASQLHSVDTTNAEIHVKFNSFDQRNKEDVKTNINDE